jgi:hypothetical protein
VAEAFVVRGKIEMFSFNWGGVYGSRRRLSEPGASLLSLAVGVVVVVLVGVSIGPAIGAAQGHGTRGFFVAQSESCGRHGCTWSGEFRLPDGQVTRNDVGFEGSYASMQVGSVVPALDAGDFSNVFPRHGSINWLIELAVGVFAIFLIGRAAWKLAKRRRGRFGAAADTNITYSGTADSGEASSLDLRSFDVSEPQ